MCEFCIEKLEQEKAAHQKTKGELEMVTKEKQELVFKFERLADNISMTFSKMLLFMAIPMWISMLNYQVIIRLHPAKDILIVQLSLSVLLVLISILMGVTEKGIMSKLKRALKKGVNKLLNI